MRVFVTGASGFIGQAVVKELVANGHAVLGLARTDEKAAQLAKLGADVLQHRTDAARLYRLAVEKGAAGVRFQGVAEEGIAMKTIAEAIGRGLGVPTKSIAPADAQAHFAFLARFAGVDCPTSSATTQKALGWTPAGPDLASDIEKHYVRA